MLLLYHILHSALHDISYCISGLIKSIIHIIEHIAAEIVTAMSFQLTTYPGVGEDNSSKYHYSQAVKVGNIIRTSGQGGWVWDDNREITKVIRDIDDQIAKAFENAMTAVNQIDPNVTWKVRPP